MMQLAVLLLALQDGEAQDALKQALKGAGDLKSYTFSFSRKTDGAGMMMHADEKSEGTFDKDAGAVFKDGDLEAVKVKNKFAYRFGSGDWKKLDRKGFMGMSVTFSTDGEGPDDDDMTLMRLQGWQPPHELLKAKRGMFKDVKVAEATEAIGDAECVVFTGEVESKGAGGFFFGGGGKKKDKDKDKEKPDKDAPAKARGSAKFWVDDNYNIRKAVIQTSTTYDMMGDEHTVTTTETYELSKIDDTKVEIPPDAKKAIESKDEK